MNSTRGAVEFAYGLCHALTASLLENAQSGEALALIVDSEVRHTVYRPVNTNVFLDAHGVTTDLASAARRYVRKGELWQWQRITVESVGRLAAGKDRARLRRLIRSARPLARELLRLA